MIGRAIRTRMALASVLPVLLVVLGIASLLWHGQERDLEASHQQRVELLVHQVAQFSAYGLFSGNAADLQRVVQDMQRSPGIKAVLVFDTEGRMLASAGSSALRRYDELNTLGNVARQRAMGIDVRTEAIRPSDLPMEDLFTQGEAVRRQPSAVLGHVVIEVSRDELENKKAEALLVAFWVGIVGILVGGMLAYRLGSLVVGPMMRISQMVQRIGRGNFSLTPVRDDDPLHELQDSLNLMAQRLAWGREELERQVESVTQELRLKKEQAESATLAKSRFLAAASHDLRQPSHALGLFVARLGQLPMDAQMRQLVDSLQVTVQAMQDLLDSLLDLSRLDSGNVAVRMEAIDLNALLDALRSAMQTMAETKGLRLRIRPTRLWVYSDAMLLQRMLMNLVTNAIRYTEQGSVLVVCRAHGAGGLRIEVWDSGIGIAAEHHEDIFKEFYQLARQAGDHHLGLGLGLHIVQRSAALLGHQIALRSNLGCGTRFTIVLQQAAAQSHPLVTERLGTPGDLHGMRVLLIEDNPHAREAVHALLESWGCQVFQASTYAETLQHVPTWGVPDVILSDYQLGAGATGIDCIAAVRSQAQANVPACLLSGETHEDFLQAAKAAELPVLHKPVRPAKLRSLLRHLRT